MATGLLKIKCLAAHSVWSCSRILYHMPRRKMWAQARTCRDEFSDIRRRQTDRRWLKAVRGDFGGVMKLFSTLGVAATLILGGVADAGELWLYETGTPVTLDGAFMACDTPTSLDEFRAMAAMKAVAEMMAYPHCILAPTGHYDGVFVEGFGEYAKIVARMPDGELKTFWTRRGFFKTKEDNEAMN